MLRYFSNFPMVKSSHYTAPSVNVLSLKMFGKTRVRFLAFDNEARLFMISHLNNFTKNSFNFWIQLNEWNSSLFSSPKPKHDMQLFVYFWFFPCFCLNLHVLRQKLFWTSKQHNFRCKTGKFRKERENHKSIRNNQLPYFGLRRKCGSVSFPKVLLKLTDL